MNNKILMRWFGLIALVLVAFFVLQSSLYTVQPGEVAAVVGNGKVTGVITGSGLHWKSPDAQVVVMNQRLQVTSVDFRADKNKPVTATRGARFNVLWKLDDPARFYAASQQKNQAQVNIQTQLANAADPALHKLLAKEDQPRVFSVSEASAMAAFKAAIQPEVARLGIKVVDASLAAINIPESEEKQLTDAMLAAHSSEQDKKLSHSHEAAEKRIAAERDKTDAILARAREKAAGIRGESEAKVADIYAEASKSEPGFFRFYQTLMSEKQALNTHTRLFVVSTDSPWFRLMGKDSSGQGGKDKMR